MKIYLFDMYVHILNIKVDVLYKLYTIYYQANVWNVIL